MCGNDRSGTVDINLNLLKAVEHALNDGYDMIPCVDMMSGKQESIKRWVLQPVMREISKHLTNSGMPTKYKQKLL